MKIESWPYVRIRKDAQIVANKVCNFPLCERVQQSLNDFFSGLLQDLLNLFLVMLVKLIEDVLDGLYVLEVEALNVLNNDYEQMAVFRGGINHLGQIFLRNSVSREAFGYLSGFKLGVLILEDVFDAFEILVKVELNLWVIFQCVQLHDLRAFS